LGASPPRTASGSLTLHKPNARFLAHSSGAAPKATAPGMSAPGPSSCMAASGPAAASAAAGWERPSSPSCAPCWSPPRRWRPPPRRWPKLKSTTSSGWPCSRSPSSAPSMKLAGPAASMTRSSQRTGWSPAPWNAWEDKLAAVRQAENDLRTQQARRPIPLTSQELAWISTAGSSPTDGIPRPGRSSAPTTASSRTASPSRPVTA